MPHLSQLKLPSIVEEILAPLAKQWQVAPVGGLVWVEHGRIRMELEDIGEGLLSGDYDPDDPDDVPLMRFGFYATNPDETDLVELDNTSFCTDIDARAPWEVKLACACEIFGLVIGHLSLGAEEEVDGSFGRQAGSACEKASWVSSSGHTRLLAAIESARQGQALSSATPAPAPTLPRARI